MENFVVSARKYRPSTFDTVVGQSHITTTLKNALKSNQLAQAFLFCGPRGVGKTTCARILAKTINCLTPTENYEACGVCESCVAFQKNSSMNIYELDAASNNSVEDIRNLVDQVRFPPSIGSKKVYIIDEVHMLSNAAFNAFLKTLEEPPGYVVFILATTEKHKIIPTILSRCQIFDFKRIEVKDIAQHLEKISEKEGIKSDYEALEVIAQKADGGLRDALSLFDMLTTFGGETGITYEVAVENLHVLDYDYYFKVTEALLTQNISEAMLVYDDILKRGFDGQNFIVGLAKHFRDLLVCKDLKTLELLEVSEKIKVKYAEQAQKASLSFIISALNIANQTDLSYKSSRNPRLHVEMALIKIGHIPAIINWQDLEQATEGEKKKSKPNLEKSTNGQARVEEPKNSYTKTAKLPSLADLEKNIIKERKVENKDFDAFQVGDIIEIFKKTFKDDLKTQNIFSKSFRIKGRHKIEFDIVQKDRAIFEEHLQRLVKFLKRGLSNEALEVSLNEVEIKEVKRIYTNLEKYNALADKYPILHEFKERLGLEIAR